MIWFILILLGVGFVFGALARMLVPGTDAMSLSGTWLLGVVGSLVGGFIGYAVFHKDSDDGAIQAGGVLSSILGAVLVLVIYRAWKSRK